MTVVVRLNEVERSYLKSLMQNHSVIWQMRTRARILLAANELTHDDAAPSPQQVAAVSNCHIRTAERVLHHYAAGGIDHAVPPASLFSGRRSRSVDPDEEEQLAAMLFEPPPGDAPHGRWTYRIAAREFGKRFGVEISPATLGRTWKRWEERRSTACNEDGCKFR